jgi:hypothetical protein
MALKLNQPRPPRKFDAAHKGTDKALYLLRYFHPSST